MKTRLWLCVLICRVLIGPQPAAAQNPPPTLIKYGDVIADKFTAEQTRFEYQFEAEEGDGVRILVVAGQWTMALLTPKYETERWIDAAQVTNEDISLYGLLVEGEYLVSIEADTNTVVPSDFGLLLERVPKLDLGDAVTGTTSVSIIESNLIHTRTFAAYLLKIPTSGIYKVEFEIAMEADQAYLSFVAPHDNIIYWLSSMRLVHPPHQTYSGSMSFALDKDHFYVIEIGSTDLDNALPVSYEIIITMQG